MEEKVKRFNWMAFDHIDKSGIWFYGTQTHLQYVWWWSPLKMLQCWFVDRNWSFGWFPFSRKHIKWK